MSELEDFHFDFEECQICDPGEERPPAIVNFIYEQSEDELEIGRCDWCNGIHIRCPKCGSVTPVPEFDYDNPKECEGGCGTNFIVESRYIGCGMNEEVASIYDEDDEN